MEPSAKLLIVFTSVLYLADLVTSYPDYVMPVPGDCTKYQVCDYSGCFVFNCGVGTEFNPRINVCDHPLRDRSECGGRVYTSGVASPSYPASQGPSYPSPLYGYPGPSRTLDLNPTYPGSNIPPPGYPYPGSRGYAAPGYGQGPSPSGYAAAPATNNV